MSQLNIPQPSDPQLCPAIHELCLILRGWIAVRLQLASRSSTNVNDESVWWFLDANISQTFVSSRDTSCFNSARRALCSVNLIFTFISSSFMRDSRSEYLPEQKEFNFLHNRSFYSFYLCCCSRALFDKSFSRFNASSSSFSTFLCSSSCRRN